jgi:hypothetical protein
MMAAFCSFWISTMHREDNRTDTGTTLMRCKRGAIHRCMSSRVDTDFKF